MNNKLFIFAFIVFFIFLTGCTKTVQWTFENIPYGADEKQTFNILLPRGNNNGHVIVYIHGGFYFFGNKLWHPLFLTEFTENTTFVTIGYRQMKQLKNTIHINDMISDVDNALIKINEVLIKNGVVVKDYILVGYSAGAHLGLLYGYKYYQENDSRDIKISACVSLSGLSDCTDDLGWSSMTYYGETIEERLTTLSRLGTELTGQKITLSQYDWTNQNDWPEYEKYAKEISPIFFVHEAEEIPPTLLVHGLNDVVIPYSNSVKLNSALEKKSVQHKLITVTGPGSNHMLGGKSNKPDSVKPIVYKNQIWVNEVKEWLELFLL
ncbi:MAG: prolyl oligopeptidase family serine peptidase [Treponema sp.]|jgi:acetyl esterase/lipase|nr:prolyl oligopeptidase family serine peptidase [Treponema sp.]